MSIENRASLFFRMFWLARNMTTHDENPASRTDKTVKGTVNVEKRRVISQGKLLRWAKAVHSIQLFKVWCLRSLLSSLDCISRSSWCASFISGGEFNHKEQVTSVCRCVSCNHELFVIPMPISSYSVGVLSLIDGRTSFNQVKSWGELLPKSWCSLAFAWTRTRTNTNPYGTETNAAGWRGKRCLCAWCACSFVRENSITLAVSPTHLLLLKCDPPAFAFIAFIQNTN
jgi:hypothetical protein